jgi:hypothetical protein
MFVFFKVDTIKDARINQKFSAIEKKDVDPP